MSTGAGCLPYCAQLRMCQSIVEVGSKTQQTLAAPDPDHLHLLGLTPIDDAKRWPDELSKKILTELGYHTPNVRMIGERIDSLKNLRH